MRFGPRFQFHLSREWLGIGYGLSTFTFTLGDSDRVIASRRAVYVALGFFSVLWFFR